MYYLGIDGGGTKTEAVVLSKERKELARYISGAINYNGESRENIFKNMAELFEKINRDYPLSDCRQIVIGMAGISNPDAVSTMKAALSSANVSLPYLIKGDQETGLYGALDGEAGIVLIAGTGSICVGRGRTDRLFRTGGCGNIIDDGGSGYAIGRDILSAVVRAADGRGPETVLSGLVFDYLGTVTDDGASAVESEQSGGGGLVSRLIKYLYDKKTSKGDVAAFGRLISQGIEKRDPVSFAIADRAVDELYLLVSALIEKMKREEAFFGDLTVAYSGSVLLKNEYIRNSLSNRLQTRYNGCSCISPLHDAAYGAALMGIKYCSDCR